MGSATPPLKNTTAIEYFEELLNRPSPVKPPDIQPAEENLPIDCRKPIKEEIKMAIWLLRNRKASGSDGILAEALKADIMDIN